MDKTNQIPDFRKLTHEIVNARARVAGVEAVKFFNENFVKEGFVDRSFSPWPRRVSPFGNTKLLLGAGKLARSVRPQTISPQSVIIISDTPYSSIHNDGGTIVVTEQMKKYWWVQYYNLSRKIKKTSRGRISQSKPNQAGSKKAAFCKAMALMKTGTKIKIPKRQFMGHSETLMSNLDKWVATQISQFLNND